LDKFWLKSISTIVLFCFTVTNTLWAGYTPADFSSVQGVSPRGLSPKGHPSSVHPYAQIDEVYEGKKDSKPVYFIQDAHTSLEAQENIAAVIQKLVSEKGIQTVYVEGYEGPVPLDNIFSDVSDTETKQEISHFLMDYLRVNGARYAYINRQQDFRLLGIERLEDYQANLESYREVSLNQEILSKDLEKISKLLKTLASRIYPREVKQYLKLKTRFENEKLSLADYIFRLFKLQSALSTQQSAKYPHIQVINEYLNQKKLSKIETEELNKKLGEVDPKVFFAELNRFEKDFEDVYLTDSVAKETFRYQEILKLLIEISQLRITTEQYKRLKTEFPDFKTTDLVQFLANQLKKPLVLSDKWEQLIEKAFRFYELAFKRDQNFQRVLDSALTPNTLDLTPILVVAGGFHKEGITSFLKSKENSYTVISPTITRSDPIHEKRYQYLMSGQFYDHEKPFLLASHTAIPVQLELLPRPAQQVRVLHAVYKAKGAIHASTVTAMAASLGEDRGPKKLTPPGTKHMDAKSRLQNFLQKHLRGETKPPRYINPYSVRGAALGPWYVTVAIDVGDETFEFMNPKPERSKQGAEMKAAQIALDNREFRDFVAKASASGSSLGKEVATKEFKVIAQKGLGGLDVNDVWLRKKKKQHLWVKRKGTKEWVDILDDVELRRFLPKGNQFSLKVEGPEAGKLMDRIVKLWVKERKVVQPVQGASLGDASGEEAEKKEAHGRMQIYTNFPFAFQMEAKDGALLLKQLLIHRKYMKIARIPDDTKIDDPETINIKLEQDKLYILSRSGAGIHWQSFEPSENDVFIISKQGDIQYFPGAVGDERAFDYLKNLRSFSFEELRDSVVKKEYETEIRLFFQKTQYLKDGTAKLISLFHEERGKPYAVTLLLHQDTYRGDLKGKGIMYHIYVTENPKKEVPGELINARYRKGFVWLPFNYKGDLMEAGISMNDDQKTELPWVEDFLRWWLDSQIGRPFTRNNPTLTNELARGASLGKGAASDFVGVLNKKEVKGLSRKVSEASESDALFSGHSLGNKMPEVDVEWVLQNLRAVKAIRAATEIGASKVSETFEGMKQEPVVVAISRGQYDSLPADLKSKVSTYIQKMLVRKNIKLLFSGSLPPEFQLLQNHLGDKYIQRISTDFNHASLIDPTLKHFLGEGKILHYSANLNSARAVSEKLGEFQDRFVLVNQKGFNEDLLPAAILFVSGDAAYRDAFERDKNNPYAFWVPSDIGQYLMKIARDHLLSLRLAIAA